MPTTEPKEGNVRAGRTTAMVGCGLLAGGGFYFAGGSMHPSDDPPGLSVKEHLQILSTTRANTPRMRCCWWR